MIDCVCQIPNRLPINTTLHGASPLSDPIRDRIPMPPQVSGRSVRIVPLTFYKVFSHWGSGRYEHIFATDEPFEVLNLLSYWSSTSIKQQPTCDHIGSVLIPISVRRVGRMDGKTLDRTKHDPNSLIPANAFVVPTASTFLFSKNIDFLIRNYRDNRPLAQVNNLERYTHQDTLHGIEFPMSYTYAGDIMLSGGVRSYGDYQKFIFEDMLYTRFGSIGLNPYEELVLSSMTPELPERINSCLEEINLNYSSRDQLYDYIDDMAMYESGKHLEITDIFGDYIYDEYPPDPITTECLRSPSYILLHTLRSYIGDYMRMHSYSKIARNVQDDSFTRQITPASFNDSTMLTTKYDLIESLSKIPSSDFTIETTWDNVTGYQHSYFELGRVENDGNGYYLPMIHSIVRQLFLNRWADHNAYEKVIIFKNWLDEIFICCHKNGGYVTYYINLAWFHLISPSLVNAHQFFKN